MKAIREFAEATAVCMGGVGYLSQRESVLEYTEKKKKKKAASWEHLQLREQAQPME